VIGGGWIAESIVPAIGPAGGELVGLADPDPRRRHRWASTCATFESAAALVDHGLDVAFVLTPTATHADLACAVLAAGAHVVVEKPLAGDRASCDRIVAAAAAGGRRALVEESYLWTPSHLAALDAVADGRIGALRSIVHTFHGWTPLPERAAAVATANAHGWRTAAPFAWVRDHVVHLFALSKRLAGATTVERVRALGGPGEAELRGATWRCGAVEVVWIRCTSGPEGALGARTGLHTRLVGTDAWLDVLGEGGAWGDDGPTAALRFADGTTGAVETPPDLLWQAATGYYPVAHQRCVAATLAHLGGAAVPVYDVLDGRDDVIATEALIGDAAS
jgi:predicted dehydrogenase